MINRRLPHAADRQMHPVVVPHGARPQCHGRAVLGTTDIDAGQIDPVDTHVELRGIARRNIEPERHATEERAGFLRVAAAKDPVPLQERPIEERHRAGPHLEFPRSPNVTILA